jgi:hypothetical protein
MLQVLDEQGVTIVHLSAQPRVMAPLFAACYDSKLLYGEGCAHIRKMGTRTPCP